MARVVMYRQCRLEKNVEGGKCVQMSYIPEPYCEVGKILKLRGEDKIWEDGWRVTFAGAKRSFEQVDVQSQQYKKQRRASDI